MEFTFTKKELEIINLATSEYEVILSDRLKSNCGPEERIKKDTLKYDYVTAVRVKLSKIFEKDIEVVNMELSINELKVIKHSLKIELSIINRMLQREVDNALIIGNLTLTKYDTKIIRIKIKKGIAELKLKGEIIKW